MHTAAVADVVACCGFHSWPDLCLCVERVSPGVRRRSDAIDDQFEKMCLGQMSWRQEISTRRRLDVERSRQKDYRRGVSHKTVCTRQAHNSKHPWNSENDGRDVDEVVMAGGWWHKKAAQSAAKWYSPGRQVTAEKKGTKNVWNCYIAFPSHWWHQM